MLLALLLSACDGGQAPVEGASLAGEERFRWKLVTSWPKNFPGLGTAPNRLAERVAAMSAGRLRITVYGSNELVPALEVFDAVSRGTVEMGHSASYYWKGKVPAAQFFASIPFGFTAQELNGWLHHGGGLELWREVYAPFNLVPLAGGNTGVQMGGWFRHEIHSLEDLKGLKMRIPGLGGEVFRRLGGTAVTLPGGELFTALQTGVIDATEWAGPYNDLSFGLHKVAKYYYYPGWQEPGSGLEFLIHQEAYDSLPEDLRAILVTAARAVNQDVLDEYTVRNSHALRELQTRHGVQLRPFPPAVLKQLRAYSLEVLEELSSTDPVARKVYESFQEFSELVAPYHRISEEAYIEARRKY